MSNSFDLFICRDFDAGADRCGGFKNSLLYRAVTGYGIARDEAETLILLRTKNGKPFFENSDICFNISHSRDTWACLMGLSYCGLDIQYIRPCDHEKIAGRFFSPAEQRYVMENGADGFFDIWVRREAYGKFTGDGFFGKCPEFVLNGKLQDRFPGDIRIVPVDLGPAYDGLKCAVCAEGPVEVSNIREDW